MTQTLFNIDDLLHCYKQARLSWEAWSYLNNMGVNKNGNPLPQSAKDNKLLAHLRYLTFKDFHIEATKILKKSPNNPSNIYYGLEHFENTSVISTKEKVSILARFDEVEDISNKLIKLRNKLYAHLDADHRELLKPVIINDYIRLIILIEETIIAFIGEDKMQELLLSIDSRDDFVLNF